MAIVFPKESFAIAMPILVPAVKQLLTEQEVLHVDNEELSNPADVSPN
jgi:hypothetical protein